MIRSLANNPHRKLRIGTAGAVHVPYKGHRFVCRALAGLKAKGICRFEYHLAGGGDDSRIRELVRNLDIEDLIVFEGQMAHDQIYSWLDSLDLYIQPSEVEGLSRALIEAMSRASCLRIRYRRQPGAFGLILYPQMRRCQRDRAGITGIDA